MPTVCTSLPTWPTETAVGAMAISAGVTVAPSGDTLTPQGLT